MQACVAPLTIECSTGRKSWKRRWFALRGSELVYMPSDEEDAEVLGAIDIKNCEDIIEVCPA